MARQSQTSLPRGGPSRIRLCLDGQNPGYLNWSGQNLIDQNRSGQNHLGDLDPGHRTVDADDRSYPPFLPLPFNQILTHLDRTRIVKVA